MQKVIYLVTWQLSQTHRSAFESGTAAREFIAALPTFATVETIILHMDD